MKVKLLGVGSRESGISICAPLQGGAGAIAIAEIKVIPHADWVLFKVGEVRPHERGRLARMRTGQDARAIVQPAVHTVLAPTSPTINYSRRNRLMDCAIAFSRVRDLVRPVVRLRPLAPDQLGLFRVDGFRNLKPPNGLLSYAAF